jgi:hypothetical protein
MTKSLSYIYPHKDRTTLFRHNLDSLLNQTDHDFEIVTVDNSDDPQPWIDLVLEYRLKGLNIKAAIVDPTKCVHFVQKYEGNVNPAASQNFAVKMSSGDIITLSSPEVINAIDNVKNIKAFFESKENEFKFLYGWVDDRSVQETADLRKADLTYETIKAFCGPWTRASSKCRPESFNPCNYYLGSLLKKHFEAIGGIDERYMQGVACEDDDFARRIQMHGIVPKISENVAGIHLSHEKTWWHKYHYINRKLLFEFNPKDAPGGRTEYGMGSESILVRYI